MISYSWEASLFIIDSFCSLIIIIGGTIFISFNSNEIILIIITLFFLRFLMIVRLFFILKFFLVLKFFKERTAFGPSCSSRNTSLRNLFTRSLRWKQSPSYVSRTDVRCKYSHHWLVIRGKRRPQLEIELPLSVSANFYAIQLVMLVAMRKIR